MRTTGLIASILLFMYCSSVPKLQKEPPTKLGEVYMQSWVAGIEGGGSGINVYVETLSNNVILDSMYFRGNVAKLETKPVNANWYIGRFMTEGNHMQDSDLNTFTDHPKQKDIAHKFALDDNECVVSYREMDKTKYFKITNIEEKPAESYPSAKPQVKNGQPEQ